MFDDRQSYSHDRENSLRSVLWCLRALAAATWPFTRKNGGSEFPGSAAMGTTVVLVFLAMGANTVGAWVYLWLWTLAILRLRAEVIRNRKNGVVFHRFWTGTPWLAQLLLPRMKNIGMLKGNEAFIVAGIGIALTYADPAVGGIVIVSAIASFAVENIWIQIRRNRIAAMRDAQEQMGQLLDDYHNGV